MTEDRETLYKNRWLNETLGQWYDEGGMTTMVLHKYPKDTDLSYLPRGFYLSGGDGGDGMCFRFNRESLRQLRDILSAIDLEDELLVDRGNI